MNQTSLISFYVSLRPLLLIHSLKVSDTFCPLFLLVALYLPFTVAATFYDSQQNCAGMSQDYQVITELLQEPLSEACSKGLN